MNKAKILMPLLAGGLAMTLVACGGQPPAPTAAPGGESPSGAPSTDPTTAPEQASWDINQTSRDKLKEGGEFKGSYSSEITTWNVASATGNDFDLKELLIPVSPSYFTYTGAGDAVLDPDYLVSADPVVTDGKLVVTLALNPKAVWNDGEVIGADDWIATWEALRGKNKEFAAASSDGWDQIESVEAGATQQDVIITFKAAYPDWTSIVSGGPIRAEGAKDPKTFNDGWATVKQEYFTGPFMISNFDKNSGIVTMEQNPTWWGDKPFLDKVTWKLIAADAVSAAFASQELDYIDIGADADAYQKASTTPNAVIRTAAGPNFRHFTFNAESPVLQDVNVRQAIIMGIDRTIIAKSDLAGLPGEFTPLNNNLFVMGQTGYVDQAAATGIDYNPEAAKKKLEEAGWALNSSSGFYEKDGKQLDVEFAVLGGVKASENEGIQAQSSLKQIGVNLTLRTVDTTKDWPAVLVEHKFDIIAFSWIGTPYPLANIGQIYGGGIDEKSGKWKANDSNFAQLEIEGLDALKQQIDTEMDPAKRLDLGNQAAELIWKAGHTLPLYQRPMLIGVRDGLANIGAVGMAQHNQNWEDIGFVA